MCLLFAANEFPEMEKTKKKKKNKKLDNVNKVTTFAVPTNREPLNGC